MWGYILQRNPFLASDEVYGCGNWNSEKLSNFGGKRGTFNKYLLVIITVIIKWSPHRVFKMKTIQVILFPLELDTIVQSTLNTAHRDQVLDVLTEKHYF